jgi:N utilization substance protein A
LRDTEILDLAGPRLDKPAIKILRSSPEISELAVLPSMPAFTRISITSAEQLGVDSEVAGVLIDEGFASIDDIADADAASLEAVEEFDATMVEELQERASDAQLVQALGDAESSEVLTSVEGVDEDLAQALIEAEIATVDDLAELSIDELLDIQRLDKEVASAIIMTARENEGWFK